MATVSTHQPDFARLVSLMATRRDRMGAIAHQERAILNHSNDDARAGFGVGFFHGDEVLLKKRPRGDQGVRDWHSVLPRLESHCAVLHAREATIGDFRNENLHPFRMRSWLFAHVGTIDGFELIRDRLVDSIEASLGRNIRGQTDSEVLFHVVLSFLHDAGQLELRHPDSNALALAIRSTFTLIDRLCVEVGKAPPCFSLVLTNGYVLGAMTRGLPLGFLHRDSLFDPPEALESPGDLRYVMVCSGEHSELTPLKNGQLLVVERSAEFSFA